MTRLIYILPLVFTLSLAGAVSFVKERRAARGVVAQAEIVQPAPVAPSTPREQWAVDFLARLGNTQPTADTVAMVVEWTMAEDSGDGAMERGNPLNTTMPSADETHTINDDGVRGYSGREAGMDATVATITNGLYDGVVAALQANDAEGAKRALWASPWASSHYGYGSSWPAYAVEDTRGGVSLPSCPANAPCDPSNDGGYKCRYTMTMESSTLFNTELDLYKGEGQWHGWHLGVDFVGDGEVYAPFDMTVDPEGSGVTYAADSPYTGWRVQAHFRDGVLFYAGHLREVYVQAGQFVPACTVLGLAGATTGPHTHVKLASPDAPVPCEAFEPGPYGCIDPIAYWMEH